MTPNLRVPPLAELIGRVAGCDRAAFADLYDATSDRIYSVVLRGLGDPGRAEDATEEIYLRVWTTARDYDPACGPAMDWLLAHAHQTIARHLPYRCAVSGRNFRAWRGGR
ncbi:sigma factor [Antrihabitans stalactiti]|uniref:sigma factor n=1 Tax=Antrihabitans stalactiti TaxID=2584121 RepID=UPI00146A0C5A